MKGFEKKLGRYTEVETLEKAEKISLLWRKQRNAAGEGQQFIIRTGGTPGGYFVDERRKA